MGDNKLNLKSYRSLSDSTDLIGVYCTKSQDIENFDRLHYISTVSRSLTNLPFTNVYPYLNFSELIQISYGLMTLIEEKKLNGYILDENGESNIGTSDINKIITDNMEEILSESKDIGREEIKLFLRIPRAKKLEYQLKQPYSNSSFNKRVKTLLKHDEKVLPLVEKILDLYTKKDFNSCHRTEDNRSNSQILGSFLNSIKVQCALYNNSIFSEFISKHYLKSLKNKGKSKAILLEDIL